jgi:SAM-dependent methyltransferase
MGKKIEPGGILGYNYLTDRVNKNEILFRLKTRAILAVDAISKHYKTTSGLVILDFGSAEGKTLLEMNQLMSDSIFYGVEYSRVLLKSASDLPKNIKIMHGDICNLPAGITEKSFDAVIALACLEHVPDPLYAVREATRVLKKNGLFIATCPEPFWDDFAVKVGLLREDQHECDLDKKKIISVIKNAGLELVDYKRFMWAPISYLPYLKLPVSPHFALRLDSVIERIKILNWLFVNQLVIGRMT